MMVDLRTIRGLVLTLASTIPASADMPATPPDDGTDMVCGPRCVRFIIDRYGKQVELVDLVKEIQWPDMEAGATLEQIQKSLNSRGIYTAAVRIPPHRRLSWPHPAILHMAGVDSPQGHYVVKVPGDSPDSDDLIWTGLGGWRRGSWDEVTRGFSGVALLTSPDPIRNSNAAIGQLTTTRLFWIASLVTVGAIVAHLSFQLLAKWRTNRVSG